MATKNPRIKYDVSVNVKPLVDGMRVGGKAVDNLAGKTRRASKATVQAERETKKFKEAWDGIKKLGAGSGTGLGQMTADLGDLGEGLAAVSVAAGPVALGIAAASVAAVGAVVAVAALARAAVSVAVAWDSFMVASSEVATELHRFGVVTDETATALMRAQGASDAVHLSFDRLQVQTAASLAPAFESAASEAGGLFIALGDVVEGASDALGGVSDLDAAMIDLGITAALNVAGLGLWREAAQMNAAESKNLSKLAKGREKDEKRALETQAESLRVALAAHRLTRGIVAEAERDAQRIAREEERRHADRLARWEKELEAINAITFKPFDQFVDESIQFKNASGLMRSVTRDQYDEINQLIEDHDKAFAQSAIGQEAIERQKQANIYQSSLAGASSTMGLIQMVTDARLASLDLSTAKGRDAARTLFRVQQAAAVAQVVINTAQGITQSLAQYGVPWGFIPAAAVSAVGTAQTAIILSQKPSFPVGGIVPDGLSGRSGASDHSSIAAMAGEAILNRRAVEAMGEREINRINRGAGQGSQVVVVPMYQHRVFDAFVVDNMAAGGPLSKRLDKLDSVGRVRRTR